MQSLRQANEELNLLSPEEFENVVFHVIGTGLIQKGNPIISGTIKATGLNGKKIDAKVFQDLPAMQDILNNKHVEDSLVYIFGSRRMLEDGTPNLKLGQEQFDHLKDIIKYLRTTSALDEAVRMGGDMPRLFGVIRPISANEVISRAFNLARGMVSPAYVTAEMAVRIASAKGIDILGIALSEPDAARTLRMLLEDPTNKALEKNVEVFAPQLLSWVFNQAALAGADVTLEDIRTQEEFMQSYYDTELQYAQIAAETMGYPSQWFTSSAWAAPVDPVSGAQVFPDKERLLLQEQLGGLR